MRLLGRPPPIVNASICSTTMFDPAARNCSLIARMNASTAGSPSPDWEDAGPAIRTPNARLAQMNERAFLMRVGCDTSGRVFRQTQADTGTYQFAYTSTDPGRSHRRTSPTPGTIRKTHASGRPANLRRTRVDGPGAAGLRSAR
jgi:hypothetical protein